jgi:uncharacterized protein DUF5655
VWRCPNCGQTFVSVNMPHSCEVRPLDAHFAGRPELRPVYDALLAAVEEQGPVTVNVTKSRIAFQTQIRFAGVSALRKDHLIANFVLTRPLESDRLSHEFIPPYYFVHRLRLYRPEDVDDELRGWLAEARQVGDRRHLTDPDWVRVTDPAGT